ncbi:MAG TPA: ABC transporter substrate-binding protein [Thermomicrobiales bacterium]
MNRRNDAVLGTRRISRRDTLRFGFGAAGIAATGGLIAHRSANAAGGGLGGRWAPWPHQGGETIVFLSTQLRPVEEAEKMRNTILADFEGSVDFIPEDTGPFNDRIAAEAEAGEGTIGVIGAQHGDFAALAARGYLADLTDLLQELSDRTFVEDYVQLGKFGGEEQLYIPWMQATYIMVAHREALQYLPEGLDEESLRTSLTYEQLGEWVRNINEAEGQKFGLPAGEDGLLHRFFQGYAYPSFTGGVNTTFKSEAAAQMWQWLKDTWQYANPQSVTYGAMDEPLLSGEVWVAWDHVARLISALRERTDDLIAFPAPRGPQGLGFMPVVAGLAIPKNAPDMEASRALIEYLTRPEVQATTLREVAFFPVIEGELPGDLPPGVQQEVDAVQATTSDPQALPSLLPVGLGEQDGAYNKVFRDTFQAIILDGNDIQQTLEQQAQNLQSVLDAAGASCWAPDPESEGVCQVG